MIKSYIATRLFGVRKDGVQALAEQLIWINNK